MGAERDRVARLRGGAGAKRRAAARLRRPPRPSRGRRSARWRARGTPRRARASPALPRAARGKGRQSADDGRPQGGGSRVEARTFSVRDVRVAKARALASPFP